MGWEKEYEHWRDMGHTWGPGIDDVQNYSEEELAEMQQRQDVFQQKLSEYRVSPREKYLRAGKALKDSLPSHHDIIYGNAPFDWREKYSDERMKLCQEATESLGYRFGFMDHSLRSDGLFVVAADYYGWLPNRGGNIHRFAATGIGNLEDCLQLVADFVAIGQAVTTYFGKDFHYSCKDTGELRYELESWCKMFGIALPHKEEMQTKSSFESQVHSAKTVAEALQSSSDTRKLEQMSEPEL